MKSSRWKLLAIVFAFTTFASRAVVRYVDMNTTNATPPYTNWATAAEVIQDAVDAAGVGDEVMVANGIYATGGRAVQGTLTNRVAVNKAISVRSINGPQVSVIQGHQVLGVISEGAVRCVFLTNGASLSGFTLIEGATQTVPILIFNPVAIGGGLWCEADVVVSNCVVTGNVAFLGGGGVYGGTLYDCTLSANRVAQFFYAGGGGVFRSTLYRCTLSGNSSVSEGGGASYSTLENCMLTGNSAAEHGGGAVGSSLFNCAVRNNSAYFGGGAWGGTLNNCTVNGNSATEGGGGVFQCRLNNCTVTSNSAQSYGGGAFYSVLNNCTVTSNSVPTLVGGGVYGGSVTNSIVYYNSAPNGANYAAEYDEPLYFCCTTPQPVNGFGNITNAPQFVNFGAGNLRLQSNSPCINAGRNAYADSSQDLDGDPRVAGVTVDIGAYEFQTPSSILSYAWAQQYGFPTDGSADYADPDGDGMNNWQEWRADTVPTNSLSVLRLTAVTNAGSGLQVTWQSVATRNYFLQRATNLSGAPSLSTLATNIPGQVGATTYADTTAVGAGPFFYRVGMHE